MCLSPIRIKNKSIHLNVGAPTRLLIDVPCGKCAECQSRYKMDWFVRIYMQMLHTINNSGYVLYDTLTYADCYLPLVSSICNNELKSFVSTSVRFDDLSCFRREDIAPFFKRLRSRIQHYCKKRYIPVVDIKYIIFSEYGTDDRYTHRPHYHLFIYVENKSIPPRLMSVFVAKCWQYGRTDGVLYKPWSYVKEHIYDNSYSPDVLYKVCNYVSKYVLKDSVYSAEVDKRINIISSRLFALGLSDKVVDDIIHSLNRSIRQFHLQSKGLGFDYIQSLSDDRIESIIRSGVIELPYNSNGSSTSLYYMPLYIRRRLLYDCVVDSRTNVRRYLPNDNYFISLRSSLVNNVDSMCTKYCDLYLHVLSNYERDYVDVLLNGRSIYDFVLYVVFQRGRCFRFDSDGVITPWPTDVDEYIQQLRKIYRMDYVSSYYRCVDYELSTDDDKVLFDDAYYKNSLSFKKDLFSDSNDTLLPTFLDKIIDNHSLRSDYVAEFVSFDLLFDFFSKCKSVKEIVDKKQSTYNYLKNLHSRLG